MYNATVKMIKGKNTNWGKPSESIPCGVNKVFHKLDEIDNNANIGIRDFTT